MVSTGSLKKGKVCVGATDCDCSEAQNEMHGQRREDMLNDYILHVSHMLQLCGL